MNKVKMFRFSENTAIDIIENEVNTWLRQNHKSVIVSIQYEKQSDFSEIILIHYKG